MKKICVILLFLVVSKGLLAQNGRVGVIKVRKPKSDGTTIAPEYPGGDAAMQTFIRENTEYPEPARLANIKGFVQLSFKIGAEGKISNITVTKSLDSGCDQAAVKMVKAMPVWIPAKHNQIPVAVQYELHIPFPSK
jgi:TonB family protein